MPRSITPRTTLDNLKREAKRWLNALQADDADARARFQRAHADAAAAAAVPVLRDVQHALALEHGLPGWTALKDRLATGAAMQRYDKVAEALVVAYRTGEASAMRIVWDYFGHMRTWDAMRRYVRLDLGKTEQAASGEEDAITLAEAQYLVARMQGFENWDAVRAFAASVPAGKTTMAAKAVAVYARAEPVAAAAASNAPATSTATSAATPAATAAPASSPESPSKQVILRSRDWDEVLAVMQAQRLPGLQASGQMTDALLERVSRLDHVTTLDLEGSRHLGDDGLRHLARLPRLAHLNLSGCGITDRGLGVLRRLPALESIGLAWTDISDAGAAHLAGCEHLRRVDLMGTACGDGAIHALAGKRALHEFRSGSGVTDAGLARLQDFPVFKTWQGGDVRMALLSAEARPNLLLLRGPFTDRGMAHLAGLDGLFALNLDSNQLAITGAGLVPLADLPHLSWLAFDATDDSMPQIAALPHLRFLMCQDTVAGDEGFVALSRSASIEHIWGRRCHNLQRRGFMALAEMPALRHLSVSCLNVDDVGVSALPRFPALTELMPMDVPDAGYRHIGRCPRLESLVLMYCRDTTDAATEHLTTLATLKKYFASYNRITDRTPEILSGLSSLEEITFDSCAGLTNAGLAHLARLPRLRELRVESMPGVTADVAAPFGPHVRVRFAL
jgi:hypothetical protein